MSHRGFHDTKNGRLSTIAKTRAHRILQLLMPDKTELTRGRRSSAAQARLTDSVLDLPAIKRAMIAQVWSWGTPAKWISNLLRPFRSAGGAVNKRNQQCQPNEKDIKKPIKETAMKKDKQNKRDEKSSKSWGGNTRDLLKAPCVGSGSILMPSLLGTRALRPKPISTMT